MEIQVKVGVMVDSVIRILKSAAKICDSLDGSEFAKGFSVVLF